MNQTSLDKTPSTDKDGQEARIVKLEVNVEHLNNELLLLRHSMDSLRAEMHAAHASLHAEIQTAVTILREEQQRAIEVLRTEMQRGFDALNDRLDRMNARIDRTEDRIARIEKSNELHTRWLLGLLTTVVLSAVAFGIKAFFFI